MTRNAKYQINTSLFKIFNISLARKRETGKQRNRLLTIEKQLTVTRKEVGYQKGGEMGYLGDGN